jgi:hypothetical protein
MDIKDPQVDPKLVPPGSRPITYARGQYEYQDLPAILTANGRMITRWSPTDEERAAVANGDDIFVTVYNGGVCNPMIVSIGPIDWTLI